MPGTPKEVTGAKGSTVTLNGSYMSGVNPPFSNPYYIYYKKGRFIDQSQYKAFNPVSNTVADSKVLSESDAGLWFLRVEDGNYGQIACFTEDSINVVFSATTNIQNSLLQESVNIFGNVVKNSW